MPFELVGDACGRGTGAILMRDEQPIAFEGKKLNSAEQNYRTTEQELLDVVHAFSVWRCYLEGGQSGVTVVTDHKPNSFFASMPTLSRRQARWQKFLSRFHYSWEYRPGRTNLADPLSRSPAFLNMVICCAMSVRRNQRPPPDAFMPDGDGSAPESEADVLRDIKEGYSADAYSADAKSTRTLSLEDGLWYHGDAVVLPDHANLRMHLMHEFMMLTTLSMWAAI